MDFFPPIFPILTFFGYDRNLTSNGHLKTSNGNLRKKIWEFPASELKMTERDQVRKRRSLSSVEESDAVEMKKLHRSRSFSNLIGGMDVTQPEVPRDFIKEGYMTMGTKYKRKKLFQSVKKRYWVEASSEQYQIALYSNESKTTRVYVLSLCGATIEYMPNKDNAVTEHCFCLNVKGWKKQATIHFNDQVFVFYADQNQLWQWIHYISIAIRVASQKASVDDFIESSSKIGAVERIQKDNEPDSEDYLEEIVTPVSEDEILATIEPKILRKCPSEGLMAKSEIRRDAMPTDRRILGSGRRPSIINRAVNRFQHNLSGVNQYPKRMMDPGAALKRAVSTRATSLKRNYRKSTKVDATIEPELMPAFQNKLKSSSKTVGGNIKGVSTHPQNKHPFQTRICVAIQTTVLYIQSECLRVPYFAVAITCFSLNALAGVLHGSIMYPFAIGGIHAYIKTMRYSIDFQDAYEQIVVLLLISYWISYFTSLGGSILTAIGGLSLLHYSEKKQEQRKKRLRTIRETQKFESDAIQLPSWALLPDVDRVEWLNNAMKRWWPFMKVAIQDSLKLCLNPILEENKPPYLASLEFTHIDFGAAHPVFGGIRLLPTSMEDQNIMLDVEVLYAASDNQLGEIRVVSTVGMAAKIKLRELSMSGTLRIALDPLCTEWPCFSGLSLTFIRKPKVDFSLTAAKLNITNVPFASEWLQNFLQHTLLEYIVWPRSVVVPLWDTEDIETNVTTSRSTKDCPMNCISTLFVLVDSAGHLMEQDPEDLDSYCTVSINNDIHRSNIAKNQNKPNWDERFEFQIDEQCQDSLTIQLWRHHRILPDELLGYAHVAVQSIEMEKEYKHMLKLNGTTAGYVSVALVRRKCS